MILPSIAHIAQLCAAKDVRHIVLSPGSRCAPLTLAFVRHPDIQVKTVSDERSAAFIAMGMARQMRKPVGIVCTSGSAAYNYAPAVAEAFFQQVPLIIFTADRPPEWIDQLDGQTIRQREIYGKHVKASYEMPVGQTEDDIWYASRIVSEAINMSHTYPWGPIHINVPLREPFYPVAGEEMDFSSPVKVIQQISGEKILSQEVLNELTKQWNSNSRKLIVCGQQMYDQPVTEAVQHLSIKQQIPVVADVISNMHEVKEAIRHADVFLAKKDKALYQSLQPDLLITFGLSVISKNLKLFLRKYRPKIHWHVQPSGTVADTFQSLTQVIHSEPTHFFQSMTELSAENEEQMTFFQQWQNEEQKASRFMHGLFSEKKMTSPNEFEVVQLMLQSLPEHVDLHLANSMAVRYANLIGVKEEQKNIEIFTNRGTSGIDGSNSTAVGTALASGKLTVLITGDMAFFYDRNAFWHNYLMPDLRIVILNNRGGNIFRMIEGPSRQPELEEYFVTRQMLYAENTARDFKMEYQQVDLTQEKNFAKLKAEIKSFLNTASVSAKILEIITDGKKNAEIFNQYKNLIMNNYEA